MFGFGAGGSEALSQTALFARVLQHGSSNGSSWGAQWRGVDIDHGGDGLATV